MATNTHRTLPHLLTAALVINLTLWGSDWAYRQVVVPMRQHAREGQLRDTLRTMRKMIDQYTADTQKAPQSLEELVEARYLPEIPVDPMTNSAETWEVVLEEDPIALNGERGIVDVKSGSDAVDSTGQQRYSDW